jgi:Integrase core domain
VTERQLEHVVGELGVPGEHRPVRTRADDPALLRALGRVVAVADALLDDAERACGGAQPGEAAVVLEAGDQRLRTVGLGPAVQDLADGPYVPATGLDVEQTKATYDVEPRVNRSDVTSTTIPGSLIHVDVKKLGNIPDGGGWRYVGRQQESGTGKRPPTSHAVSITTSRGHAFVHTVIDDHSRVAYAEVHDDETALTASGVLARAVAWYESCGVIERV